MCALAALAEKPERVRAMFINEDCSANQHGVFGVYMCKDGQFVEVILDEWIPTIDDQLCFSSANGPELWVILLEKAFAKLHGTYARLDGG